MSNVTVNPEGSFNNNDFWISNTSESTNEQFSGLASSSGGILSPHQEATYSTFSFASGGLIYRYNGSFNIVADFGILSGTASVSGSYNQVQVVSGGNVLATYSGPDRAVDFGTYQSAGVLDLLGNLLGGVTDLLFGPDADKDAYEGLHTDATPNLPALAVNDGLTATGGSGEDVLTGGIVLDRLYGFGGNDTLVGGAGADYLYGGAGADQHNGGAGADFARYDEANHGNLTISLVTPGLNTGAAAGDTYIDIEGVIGGAGNDTITGDSAANDLRGGGGNDQLHGGIGGDMLSGGFGADALIGGDGSGIDYARYDDANYGNLTIRLLNPQFNTGAAAGDSYIGIEGLIGGAGNDLVIGNSADNFLWGSGGNDLIDGAGGNDVLQGGTGADDFRFTTTLGAGNIDTISGFEHGIDDIVLFSPVFAGIGGTLDASEFGSTADPNNFIIYNQGTGQLYYDAGGSAGGAAPVQFATLNPGTTLDINDFVLL